MSAVNDYASLPTTLESPGRHSALIAPSDANELAHVARAFQIAAAGAVSFTTICGEHISAASGYFAPGVQHCGFIKQFHASGTDAAEILVWW